MIAMTIDFRGATPEQISKFCEIPGMRSALYELLYQNRRHDATVAIVNDAAGPAAVPGEDLLAAISAREVAANEIRLDNGTLQVAIGLEAGGC
jgi:hypothetical protein